MATADQIHALDARITTATQELTAIDTAIANRVTIIENLNVPAGIAGLHSRVEALESASRIVSNWEKS